MWGQKQDNQLSTRRDSPLTSRDLSDDPSGPGWSDPGCSSCCGATPPELLCFVAFCGRELVFESLEAGFFLVFVNVGFANVLAFVDFVHVGFGEFGHVEGVINFVGIDGGEAFALDASRLEGIQYQLIIFERAIVAGCALDGAELPADGLIVMETVSPVLLGSSE